MSPGSAPSEIAAQLDISCERSGAVEERSSIPLPLSNSASHRATGEPQPAS